MFIPKLDGNGTWVIDDERIWKTIITLIWLKVVEGPWSINVKVGILTVYTGLLVVFGYDDDQGLTKLSLNLMGNHVTIYEVAIQDIAVNPKQYHKKIKVQIPRIIPSVIPKLASITL